MTVINITPYQVPNNHATNSALQPHNDMPTVNLTPLTSLAVTQKRPAANR
jgi:hypothetical protein